MSETICNDLLVGQPIRDQYGITCCPAICEEDNRQFYIKTIRVPASAVQASGLLLSGAYENAEQLQEYFRSIADTLCAEADLLKDLRHMGFLPYSNWELNAVESGVGYCLELVAPRYEGIIGREWTHQDAISMALDLCNALTACRQKGWMYADLKPENIFKNDIGEYCIGDLGFLPMASLQFLSLPDKYRSVYTAPEIADIYATVSSNMDVYALGLILYGIFNNGQLPDGEMHPAAHADYELWRILSTACHPDPLMRYEDPGQMGKALLDYAQQFGLQDTVIGAAESEKEEKVQDDTLFLSEAENEAMLADLLAMIPDEQPPANMMDQLMDEPDEEQEVEVAQMLAQADDLISHQLPQPVVAPSVIDVQLPVQLDIPDEPAFEEFTQMPPMEIPREDAKIEPIAETVTDEAALSVDSADPEPEEDEEIWDAPKKVNTKKIAITISSIALIFALVICGALAYYNLIYTQTIDGLNIETSANSITVYITSDLDEQELNIVCSNANGFSFSHPVQNGKAVIENLSPGTTYFITVESSGFHRLVGQTEEIVTTKPIITVTNFTAVTGIWQGSVDLNFVSNHEKSNGWIIRYTAEGETEKTIRFDGTQVSITDLTMGKTYTFTLEDQDGAPIIGSNQVVHTIR